MSNVTFVKAAVLLKETYDLDAQCAMTLIYVLIAIGEKGIVDILNIILNISMLLTIQMTQPQDTVTVVVSDLDLTAPHSIYFSASHVKNTQQAQQYWINIVISMSHDIETT